MNLFQYFKKLYHLQCWYVLSFYCCTKEVIVLKGYLLQCTKTLNVNCLYDLFLLCLMWDVALINSSVGGMLQNQFYDYTQNTCKSCKMNASQRFRGVMLLFICCKTRSLLTDISKSQKIMT